MSPQLKWFYVFFFFFLLQAYIDLFNEDLRQYNEELALKRNERRNS